MISTFLAPRTNKLPLLPFQVMTLNPVCESVETAQGVPLTVTGVAQVKIMKNQASRKSHYSDKRIMRH